MQSAYLAKLLSVYLSARSIQVRFQSERCYIVRSLSGLAYASCLCAKPRIGIVLTMRAFQNNVRAFCTSDGPIRDNSTFSNALLRFDIRCCCHILCKPQKDGF